MKCLIVISDLASGTNQFHFCIKPNSTHHEVLKLWTFRASLTLTWPLCSIYLLEIKLQWSEMDYYLGLGRLLKALFIKIEYFIINSLRKGIRLKYNLNWQVITWNNFFLVHKHFMWYNLMNFVIRWQTQVVLIFL